MILLKKIFNLFSMRGVFKQSILTFCCFYFSIQSAHSMVELKDVCEYN